MAARFETLEVALEWAAVLRPALERIARRDPDLGRQVRRAVASVALNLAEGAERAGKDRLHLYRVAAGSLAEAGTGLRLARAWRWIVARDLEQTEALADRLRALLFRLTHPGG